MNNLPIPYHPSQFVFDSTKLQCSQDCMRFFFYEHLLGWRSARPNNHLHFGKAVHLAMEHVILHGYRVDAVMEALTLFNDEYRYAFPVETDMIFTPKTPDRFFSMLIEYLKKYSDDLRKYTVYKTEFGGTIQLDGTRKLAFKMDTILYDNDNKTYCSLEHKTKGGNYISDNYSIEHQMGIQCGTYTHVLNSLFPPEDVSGVIINCLCFKKTKKVEFILQRFPVFLTNSQMYTWLQNTISWIKLLEVELEKLSETTDRDSIMTAFPLNGRSCTNFGRTCQYIELCQNRPNPLQHLDRIPADYKVEFWNPLEEELREVLTL